MKKGLTTYFTFGDYAFERLTKVFKKSWQKNSSIPLEVHRINPPDYGRKNRGWYENHHKLKHWLDNFTEDTIFLDSDMLLLKDIAGGFDMIEHIGIAKRTGFPFNGGVIFAKYTPESTEFMQAWYEADCMMLEDEELFKTYRKTYCALNQSALGWLLDQGYDEYVTRLPESYNWCQPWHGWEQAHLVHVKDQLRRTILFDRVHPPEPQGAIRDVWKSFEEAVYA